MNRNVSYATPPNPKHAITFAIVSMAILILPLFWSPLNDQRFTPLATTTPMTVQDMLSATPSPALAEVQATAADTAAEAARVAAAAGPPFLAVEAARSAGVAIASSGTSETTAGNETAPSGQPAKFQDPTSELSGQLRRIVLSLVVTTLLIAFTLRAARNHIPALGGQKPQSFLKVLAREAISPNQSLALVHVGSKILLVGLSEQNMTTLSEFSEADLESLIPKAPEPEARTAKSMYGDILRHYLSIVPGLGAKK